MLKKFFAKMFMKMKLVIKQSNDCYEEIPKPYMKQLKSFMK